MGRTGCGFLGAAPSEGVATAGPSFVTTGSTGAVAEGGARASGRWGGPGSSAGALFGLSSGLSGIVPLRRLLLTGLVAQADPYERGGG
jgi:hypothetical protein